MVKLVRIMQIAALAALLAGGWLLAAAPARAATAPTVEPPVGTRGTEFHFRAGGFPSKESIGFYVVAPDGSVIGNDYSFTSKEDGTGSWKWRAPDDAMPGEWKMVARGATTAFEDITVIPFRIDAAPLPPQALTSVTPEQGIPGQQFRFTALGFNPGEGVSFWANTPDGRALGDPSFYTGANGDGFAAWDWTAPPAAMPGEWLMVARGLDSATERVIRFRIGAGPAAPPAAQPPAAPESAVAPPVGVAETTFNFYVTGLKPGERYVYWTATPDGRSVGDPSFYGFVEPNGRADLSWKAPQGATPGVWLMVVYGLDSRETRTVRFEIA